MMKAINIKASDAVETFCWKLSFLFFIVIMWNSALFDIYWLEKVK